MLLEPSLRACVAQRLQAFAPQTAPAPFAATAPPAQRAAVALTLLDEGWGADVPGLAKPQAWSGAAAVLLTRRALTLRHHPGQWALPGGRIEPGESPAQAALRELEEEVGLRLGEDAVLGHLDDFVTRSGFAITPIVVWAGPTRTPLRPNPDEVASIHRIALAELLRDDAPQLEAIDDSPHPVLRMPVGHSWVAAPTAALLYQFREVGLADRATRVAHFEQPLFARR